MGLAARRRDDRRCGGPAAARLCPWLGWLARRWRLWLWIGGRPDPACRLLRGGAVAPAVLLTLALAFTLGCGAWAQGNWAVAAAATTTPPAATSPPESPPLQITLSQGGTWDIRGERLTADGQVEVRYQDWTLQADHLDATLTKGKERLIAQGHVVYTRPGQTLRSSALSIDLADRRGQVEQVTATLELPSKKDSLYLTTPRLLADKDRYQVDQASLTTCDLARPHYHLDARRVTVYLGDRIVIEGVTFHDFGLPLFYWPRLTIPLRRQSTLELPQFGYSRSQGWFVKTSYSYYPVGWQAHGRIHLDYYSLLGWGVGLDHFYRDNARGQGVLSLYVQPNRATDHVDTTLNWQDRYQPRPDLVLEGEAKYSTQAASDEPTAVVDNPVLPQAESQEWSARLAASYQSDPWQLQGSWSISGQQVQGGSGELLSSSAKQALSLSGSTHFGSGVSLSLAAQQQQGRQGDSPAWTRTSYRLQLSQPLRWFRWATGLEQEVNPDLDEAGQPILWTAFSRSPYLSLQGKPLRLPAGFSFNWNAEAARLQEAQWNGLMRAGRGLIGLQLASPTWTLRPGLTFNLSGQAQAAAYGTGQQQVAVTSTASLTQRWQAFSVGLRHEDQTVWGSSPFYFDRQLPSESLTLTGRYERPPFTLALTGGYDLYWQRWRNVMAELAWNPNPARGVTAGMVIRPSGELVGAAVSASWTPDPRHQLQLGVAYNAVAQTFDRFNGALRLPLVGPFSVEAAVAYDGTTQLLSQAQASLVWNLHCRTVSFRYDQVQKAFWVQYQINAFPEAAVGAGAGQSGLNLDVEGLRGFLDKWSGGNAGAS